MQQIAVRNKLEPVGETCTFEGWEDACGHPWNGTDNIPIYATWECFTIWGGSIGYGDDGSPANTGDNGDGSTGGGESSSGPCGMGRWYTQSPCNSASQETDPSPWNDEQPPLYIDPQQSDPPIDLQKYLHCFATIPDAGAIYEIKICADVPFNWWPTSEFNVAGSPGHTFLTLTKTNGNQSITQSVGFYPDHISQNSTSSHWVDNGTPGAEHEYNASITVHNAGAVAFQNILNSLSVIENYNYNIQSWNCTNAALSAFNT